MNFRTTNEELAADDAFTLPKINTDPWTDEEALEAYVCLGLIEPAHYNVRVHDRGE